MATVLLSGVLVSCAAKRNLQYHDTASTFYGQSFSQHIIPVRLEGKLEKTRVDPDRLLFTVMENVEHEGALAIPRGSTLSTVRYYRDSPHWVVDAIRLGGRGFWTPAQGVVTRHSTLGGTATLSHVTVPVSGGAATSVANPADGRLRPLKSSVGYRSK